MRLIDADVVEDTLKKCVSNAYVRRELKCVTGVSLAILQLRNIPTAYDIDNVVEELETNKQNALEVEESIKEYKVWNDAIEIVKQGGVRKNAE